VPGHDGAVVDRGWDGDVWTDETRPLPDQGPFPKYHRHAFGFLRTPGWKCLLVFLLATGAGAALWLTDRHAAWVSGIQIPLPLLSGIGAVATMAALLLFLNRRIGFDRIPAGTRRSIYKWGLSSAVIGFALAYGIEFAVPRIFGESVRHDPGWSVLAGPAEETGKLLVPVILWTRGRFRVPREGYLLVLVSAACVGVFEGFEYGLNPDDWQPARPFFEIMHPLLTGFVAAVAWRAAWHRDSIFTGAAIGAWFIAMAAHSTNDVVVLDHDAKSLLSYITVFTVILMYLLQKHVARQMVPPDKVPEVSPRWRPVAPRS
jgi:hypothetical protein